MNGTPGHSLFNTLGCLRPAGPGAGRGGLAGRVPVAPGPLAGRAPCPRPGPKIRPWNHWRPPQRPGETRTPGRLSEHSVTVVYKQPSLTAVTLLYLNAF